MSRLTQGLSQIINLYRYRVNKVKADRDAQVSKIKTDRVTISDLARKLKSLEGDSPEKKNKLKDLVEHLRKDLTYKKNSIRTKQDNDLNISENITNLESPKSKIETVLCVLEDKFEDSMADELSIIYKSRSQTKNNVLKGIGSAVNVLAHSGPFVPRLLQRHIGLNSSLKRDGQVVRNDFQNIWKALK